MKYILCILCICMSLICYADVYKTVDANGNVIYTDKPTTPNSVPIELPKLNTIPSNASKAIPANPRSPTTENNTANVAIDPNARQPYTKFIIESPANQETIQNQPTIPVKIAIEPVLQSGDVIQLYLDGAPWGSAMPTTTFNLTAPDRGTHVLSATLFDNNMHVLKQSNSNTVYIHHAHL